MNILHYDLKNFDLNDIAEIVKYLNNKGFEVVAIPKEIDLLIDCDSYTLHLIKSKIEEAIRIKEAINDL